MKKIIFPSSHWGSNVGNAFFHLGNQYILNQVMPEAEVVFFDLRSEKAFMPSSDQMKYDSLYYENVEGADYLLLDGPLFDESFEHLFGGILKRAKDAGVKIILMSTGGINYTESEIKHCRKVLEKYKPYILTTRDRETYDAYSDLAEYAYDGICGAWFSPDFYPGIDTPNLQQYMTVCFDHTYEPKISLGAFDRSNPASFNSVEVGEVKHTKLTKIGRLLKRGGYPLIIDNHQVIRPTHQVLHRPNWRLYFKENSFFSQTPWGYLNLYRNTDLTITDRLHAAVATLSYGNPARLFIKSKRDKLLNRMDLQEVGRGVITADMSKLKQEKEDYISWMKKVLEG